VPEIGNNYIAVWEPLLIKGYNAKRNVTAVFAYNIDVMVCVSIFMLYSILLRV